jgi:hypothetical protein
MRNILIAFALYAVTASANPALHGTWSAANVQGKPLLVEFAPGGTGKLNGAPMKWSTLGGALFVQQAGQVANYGFKVQGDKLLVYPNGQLQPMTLTKGSEAYDTAMKNQPKQAAAVAGAAPGKGAGSVSSGGNGQELVGKWCDVGAMSTYQGGSSHMACFELRADGTYSYSAESSRSVNTSTVYGGTASQSSDSGRWSYNGAQLVAQSRNGQTHTYNLEKRNHPKNKRDPMICLNGACYVTFYNKPAW